MSAQDAAVVDAAVQKVFTAEAQEYFPGLWVGVWDPQRGYYLKAFGKAVVGGADAAVDQSFRIGSITKTFTATVILELVDQGKLTLDQTVTQAAPQVAKKHPEVADRTVKDLLSMTSGIPDYLNVPDGVAAKVTKDPSRVWSADELIQAGVDGGLKPIGTPGYSTTNFILLQEIAEEVTGQSLQDLIAAQVTEPLGMTHTILPPNDDTTLPEPSTHGYLNQMCVQELEADGGTATPGQDATDWSMSVAQGGGAMSATIADLGRWGAAGSGNLLLKPETVTQRMQLASIGDDVTYGLGIMNIGDHGTGHDGEAFGWEAEVSHNDATGRTYAFGTNACSYGASLFIGLRTNLDQQLPAAGSSAAASATP